MSNQQTLSTDYESLLKQATALVSGEPSLMANLANISALLNEHLADINWVGFYITEQQAAQKTLVLGPFQGKVACVRIPFGQGVCGTAAQSQQTQLVADVHAFAGHIACDAASNAEVVVPIVVAGQVVAVLDIDSPSLNRFTEHDREGLQKFGTLIEGLNW